MSEPLEPLTPAERRAVIAILKEQDWSRVSLARHVYRCRAEVSALQIALREMLNLFIDPAKVTDLPAYTAINPTFSGPSLAHLRKWHAALPKEPA